MTATVTGHNTRTENLGHKLYMDNFFSSPDLFSNLHTKAINCCGTVRPNLKRMPYDFGKKPKLKRGDLIAILWKEKRNVNMLRNMRCPPAEGNFCDEYGKVLKPAIVQDYNRHMGCIDKNSYSISKCTWKWVKNFFHLLNHSILKFYCPYL
jgi:hypothetical protein